MKLETRNLQAKSADRTDPRFPSPSAVFASSARNSQPPTPDSRFPIPGSRAGFTLIEMLTVIAIISILIGVTGLSLIKARELSRRTRADAELREMVAAWLQYQQLYGEWPSVVSEMTPVTGALLDPLTNPKNTDNPRGIVFLNVTLADEKSTFNDPWGTPYQLAFNRDNVNIPTITALRTSISFPNRQRRFP